MRNNDNGGNKRFTNDGYRPDLLKGFKPRLQDYGHQPKSGLDTSNPPRSGSAVPDPPKSQN